MPKRVLIADDHFPVRFGVEMMVKDCLGTATSVDFAVDGHDVLEKVSGSAYDLLITDMIMPGTDFLSMVQKALECQPGLKILIVSVNPKEIYAQRYINAGVSGYVNKAECDSELKKAIQYAFLGKKYIGGGTVPDNAHKVPINPFDCLSSREFETMALLIRGAGISEVANALSLKASTVSTFRNRIFTKLCVKNIFELTNLARKHGLQNE